MTDTRRINPRAEARAELGALLRESREKHAMSLSTVARVTKIPTMSLERLEAGRFDELPAKVFVRGFLDSYARCVGIDRADVLERYLACENAPTRLPRGTTHDSPESASAEAASPTEVEASEGRSAPTTRTRLQATGTFLRNQLFEQEPPAKRRGAVTLAVIILVVVATLTMSYLLRRPSHTGDGVTQRQQELPSSIDAFV